MIAPVALRSEPPSPPRSPAGGCSTGGGSSHPRAPRSSRCASSTPASGCASPRRACSPPATWPAGSRRSCWRSPTSSSGPRRCSPGRSCSTSRTVRSPGSSVRPRRSAYSWTRWPTWSRSASRRPCWCTPGRCPRTRSLAWLSAFFWLACAAFRLARFNVTVDPLADKKYFVGLPSPGATLVVIATILALRTPEHGPGMLVPVAVSVIPAAADGHHRPLPVLPRAALAAGPPRPGPRRLCSALRLVVGLVLDAAATGLVVACAYLLTAPLGVLTAPVRARVFGAQAVAPPRHTDAVGVPADHRRRGRTGQLRALKLSRPSVTPATPSAG